jgi:hypothetical protein
MAFHPTAFRRLVTLVLLAGAMSIRSWGQAADSPIKFLAPEAITTTLVDAPSVGGSSAPLGEGVQWLKIEYHYQIDPKGTTPFVDSIQFNITVEARDLYAKNATTPDGISVGLTGSETYINLAATRDGYGVFYIHPSTLARYASKNGTGDFTEKFNIHLEAMVDGKLADYIDKQTDPMGLDWYKALTPVTGLVLRQDQCCFIVSDPSRYPQLKTPVQP